LSCLEIAEAMTMKTVLSRPWSLAERRVFLMLSHLVRPVVKIRRGTVRVDRPCRYAEYIGGGPFSVLKLAQEDEWVWMEVGLGH
jgi:hypothetical protein